MAHENPPLEKLRTILENTKIIAMVGASANPEHHSNSVMKRLQAIGFRIIPVHPRETEILGEKVYRSLSEIPVPVDIVDVFRKAEETPAIADEAVKIGAKVLWLQLGISNEEAARRAEAGGLTVVMDRCVGRTLGELGMAKW